jgi:hypothetical protein
VKVGEIIKFLNGIKIEMNYCKKVKGEDDGNMRIGGDDNKKIGKEKSEKV